MGGVGVFGALWVCQFLSLFGTDITKFALRVWTYQDTLSVTQFAAITVCAQVPALLLSPITGSLVDRLPRKWTLITADLISCFVTLVQYGLWLSGSLQSYHLWIASAIIAVANAVQWPAFMATIPLLIPPEKLARFGGLNQAAPALSMLLSPTLAALVVSIGGLGGAMLIEASTAALAVLVTLCCRIPQPPDAGTSVTAGQLWSDGMAAWGWIRTRPGLVGLLFLLACGHFSSGMVQILMTPVVLSLASPQALGAVLTVSGLGALLGSGLLAAWGGAKQRHSLVVISCVIVQGLLLALCGVMRTVPLILGIAFCYMAVIPINRASRETIWQRKVPASMQGRVFALQRGLSECAMPVASLVSGPLTDWVADPLVHPDGSLGSILGPILGDRGGKGAALMFILLGLSNAALAGLGLLYPPLRRVDLELPDADVKNSGEKKKE